MSEFVPVHPPTEQIKAFGMGLLAPEAMDEVERHISECGQCCDSLRNLDEDTLIGLAKEAAQFDPARIETAPSLTVLYSALRLNVSEVPTELLKHGRYQILEILGAGGMGVVFKAEHRIMERTVALKVIARHLTAKPDAVERFRREVKAAARLHHPNIVTAHDAEQAGDIHFLVMEYVDGVSLSRYVEKKGPLPISHIYSFLRQAALGLQHAHERGMVHRDIKPANLMITKKGQLKILDFGLTRLTDDRAFTKPTKDVTAHDMILGTPDYLAPEQTRSARVDIRADLYALGCTFYFALTGQPPFPNMSPFEKLLAHNEQEPEPIRQFRNDVPEELLAVVQMLMSKNPDDRFQTPRELADVVTAIAKGETVVTEVEVVTPSREVSTTAPTLLEAPSREEPKREEPKREEPKRDRQPLRKKRRKSDADSQRLAVRAGIAAAVAGVLIGLAIAFLPRGNKTIADNSDDVPSNKANANSPNGGNSGTTPGINPSPQVSGTTRTLLYLVPAQEVWEPDYLPVKRTLEKAGYKVLTASRTREPVSQITRRELPPPGNLKIDLTFNEIDTKKFDAVLMCGYRVQPLYTDPTTSDTLRRVLREFQREGKPIAAICAGQGILMGLNLFPDKQFLASPLVKEQFPDEWTREQRRWLWNDPIKVYPDGLILARGDQEAEAFARALLAKLGHDD